MSAPIFTLASAMVAAVCLTACSEAADPTKASSTSVSLTATDLFQQVASETSATKSAIYAQVAGMTIPAWYKLLTTSSSTSASSLITSHEAQFTKIAAMYDSVGQLWSANGLDPLEVKASDVAGEFSSLGLTGGSSCSSVPLATATVMANWEVLYRAQDPVSGTRIETYTNSAGSMNGADAYYAVTKKTDGSRTVTSYHSDDSTSVSQSINKYGVESSPAVSWSGSVETCIPSGGLLARNGWNVQFPAQATD